MELKIDELLTDAGDDVIYMEAAEQVSLDRVKTLTFSKIQACKPAVRRRRLPFALLAAIVVTFLALTAMGVKDIDLSGYIIHCVTLPYNITEYGQLVPADRPDFGLQFSSKNASADGVDIVCVSSAGSCSGRLVLENGYYIQRKTASGWETVAGLDDEYVFLSDPKEIAQNDTLCWRVDWSDIYGQLPPGEYRINVYIQDGKGKEIISTRSYAIEFYIGNE